MMLSIIVSTLLTLSSGTLSSDSVSSGPASSGPAPVIKTEPLFLEPCFVNGSDQALQCGFLGVAKDYINSSKSEQLTGTEKVKIHVIRSAARVGSNKKKSPLFIFAGGPGQAATDFTHMLKTSFESIKKQRDIIFVAQRGSGQSHGVTCQHLDLQSYKSLTPEMKKCRKQVEPLMSQLNTFTLVHDIEAARQALGYQSIHLWGGSYGTLAAQLYATTYPEHVASMILDAAFALDANPLVDSSEYAQQSLESVVKTCKNDLVCSDLYPNWEQELYQLLSTEPSSETDSDTDSEANIKAAFEEVLIPEALIPEALIPEVLIPEVLSGLVRGILYSPDMAAKLPYAIHHAYRGNPTMLKTMNQLFADSMGESMYMGLTLSALCQEMVFIGQSDKAREIGKNSFVKDAYYRFWKDACGDDNDQQAAYIQVPDSLTIPTLLISGGLDPITPESSANKAMRYLSNAQHIVIPNAGHTNSHLGCMPKVVNAFFVNADASYNALSEIKKVDARCIQSNQFPAFMR